MYQAIISAIKQSGEVLLKGQDKSKSIALKSKQNFITQFDLLSEKNIIKAIKKNFPKHHIHGEETGYYQGSQDFHWYIDPLSNTRSFIKNQSYYAISVGLMSSDQIIFGAVYNPPTHKLYSAYKNKGSFCNQKKLQVSKTKNLKQAVIGIDWQKRGSKKTLQEGLNIKKRLASNTNIKLLGSVALNLCFIAEKKLDAFIANFSDPHSLLGASLILKEAKGKVKDFNLKNWNLRSNSVIADNSHLSEQINKVI